MDKQKRLAIFFFYDQDGIADRYIDLFLQGLSEVCERTVIVVNGSITPQARALFARHSNEIILRENSGYDAWAHKAGLDYVGWEALGAYDEVVLTSYNLMGPVYPFSVMFSKMAQQEELDFWGAASHFGVPYNSYLYAPAESMEENINTSFIVYRNKFLKSPELQNYWAHLPEIHTQEENEKWYSSSFTKHFQSLGCQWAVYANAGDRYATENYLLYLPYQAVKESRCPVFSRRCFTLSHDYAMLATTGEQTAALFQYLKAETSYDTDSILENLLRTCNQYDIVRTLDLTYTLPSNSEISHPVQTKPGNIALVMHLYYIDLLADSVHYAASMPEQADIYITTPHKDHIARITEAFSVLPNKVEVRLIANRGRDVSSLLVGAADIQEKYKYICFFHDKKGSQEKPYSIGRSFAYKISESALCSRQYVNNIICLFEQNPHLGLLGPLPPYHSSYYYTLGCDWGPNYEGTKDLAEKLKLHIPISKDLPPVAPYGTTFWYRAEAMKKLFAQQWKYEDFPPEPNSVDGTLLHAIERIYPFVVQDAGYYPAYALPDSLAAIELTNLQFYLRNLNGVFYQNHIGTNNFTAKMGFQQKMREEKQLLQETAELRQALQTASNKLAQIEYSGDETFASGNVYGCRQTVYRNNLHLLRAARLAEIQNVQLARTIGFAPAWAVFRISVKIWLGKHSLFPSHRKTAKFLATQNLPSVTQTWWLVRNCFGNWVSKFGSRSA